MTLSLELVQMAPEAGIDEMTLSAFAEQWANMLNREAGLSPAGGAKQGVALETAESVLSFARKWSLEKNALVFTIILDRNSIIGIISLSHIDKQRAAARTGYFIASPFRGRGYGTRALGMLLDVSRSLGVTNVTASVSGDNPASRRILEKCGAEISFADGLLTARFSR